MNLLIGILIIASARLLVFYNGVQEAGDETILRLSDSFPEELRNTADIEVKVRMININYGHNKKLLEACKPLDEYEWLTNEIRKNQKEHGLQTSVKMALEDMPKDFLIISLGRIDDLKRSIHDREFQQKLFDELLPKQNK